MLYPEPLCQWGPCQIQADPNDALFPNEYSFNLGQVFDYGGDGILLSKAQVAGCLPVNRFFPNCGPPDVKSGDVAWAATGGAIPGGTTLFVQVCAAWSDLAPQVPVVKQLSPPSQVLVLQVPPGADTNTFTINNIKWPSATGLNSWVLFANTAEDLMCGQVAGLGQPTSITFTGPIKRQTYAVPDADINILRLRAQVLVHGGVLGASVDAVTTSTITSHATIDPTGHDDWSGRVLAIIGRQHGSGIAPWAHFNITAWDVQNGVYTLDRDPTAAGPNNVPPVMPGDFFAVCFKGADNSANPYVVGDSGLANNNNIPPGSGETVNDPNRIGQMVRVIKGTSRGLSAKIVANDATTYTLDRALPTDATSVWIVCDPGWNYLKDVVVDNSDPAKTTQTDIEINNYKGLALLVEGVNIDNNGTIVDDADACVRMLFIPGTQGTTTTVATAP
jgi:hypothetical protein